MSTTLTVFDETTRGDRRPALTLEFDTPTISARELVRARVFEEVKRYNQDLEAEYFGLVQPAEPERALNGERRKPGKKLDWHAQVEVALAAFESNGFLLLVDGRQITSLEQEVRVQSGIEVTFLKLVPLVGG